MKQADAHVPLSSTTDAVHRRPWVMTRCELPVPGANLAAAPAPLPMTLALGPLTLQTLPALTLDSRLTLPLLALPALTLDSRLTLPLLALPALTLDSRLAFPLLTLALDSRLTLSLLALPTLALDSRLALSLLTLSLDSRLALSLLTLALDSSLTLSLLLRATVVVALPFGPLRDARGAHGRSAMHLSQDRRTHHQGTNREDPHQLAVHDCLLRGHLRRICAV